MRKPAPPWIARIGLAGLLALSLLPAPSVDAADEAARRGAGVCRERICPCSEAQLERGMVDTEAGCCDKAGLDRLRGRLRGLREAAQAHRRDLNALTGERNEARDRLWGKGEGLSLDSGSIVAFGKASASSLASFEGVGPVVTWLNTGVSLATDPKSSEEWADAGLTFLDSPYFKSLELVQSSERANALASLAAKNGNYPAMREIFRREFDKVPKTMLTVEGVQTTTKLVGAVQALVGLAQATDAVTKDLSAWLVADKEARGLQKELDKIDDEIEKSLKEIARLRKSCPPEASFAPAGDPPRFLPVSLPLGPALAAARPDPAAVARKLEFVLKDLKKLREQIARAEKRFEERIFDPLSPWLVGTWRSVPGWMLVELAKMARADVVAFAKDLEQIHKRSEDIGRRLGAARPYGKRT